MPEIPPENETIPHPDDEKLFRFPKKQTLIDLGYTGFKSRKSFWWWLPTLWRWTKLCALVSVSAAVFVLVIIGGDKLWIRSVDIKRAAFTISEVQRPYHRQLELLSAPQTLTASDTLSLVSDLSAYEPRPPLPLSDLQPLSQILRIREEQDIRLPDLSICEIEFEIEKVAEQVSKLELPHVLLWSTLIQHMLPLLQAATFCGNQSNTTCFLDSLGKMMDLINNRKQERVSFGEQITNTECQVQVAKDNFTEHIKEVKHAWHWGLLCCTLEEPNTEFSFGWMSFHEVQEFRRLKGPCVTTFKLVVEAVEDIRAQQSVLLMETAEARLAEGLDLVQQRAQARLSNGFLGNDYPGWYLDLKEQIVLPLVLPIQPIEKEEMMEWSGKWNDILVGG